MKGLELCKRYYEEFGLPMLKEKFPEYLDQMAIGLVGHGSECFGFDDDISTDHDFEPGFCIWIHKDLEEKIGFELFREYRNLPSEYLGYKVNKNSSLGSKYKGVITIEDFFSYYLINGEVPQDNLTWYLTDEAYLSEVTNGEVFYDGLGDFTKIRNQLLLLPEDVRLKNIASGLLEMAKTGQYNYERCIKHNELASASLCLNRFVERCAHVIYLLNFKYAPYYKWLFRGLKKLDKLGNLSNTFDELLKSPYEYEKNIQTIEAICQLIIIELNNQHLSNALGVYLEPHAYAVNDNIEDSTIRNLDV